MPPYLLKLLIMDFFPYFGTLSLSQTIAEAISIPVAEKI